LSFRPFLALRYDWSGEIEMTVPDVVRNWRNYKTMLDIIRSIRRNPNERLGAIGELDVLSRDLQVSEELHHTFWDIWWDLEITYASMLARDFEPRRLTADEYQLVEESLGKLETLIHAELKKLPADDEIVDIYLDSMS
jgi:hypothetical protein